MNMSSNVCPSLGRGYFSAWPTLRRCGVQRCSL